MYVVPEAQPEWVAGDDAFRRLAESLEEVAVVLLDLNGRVATWNRGAEKLHGYACDEIVGRSFSVFHPADAVEAGHPQRELEAAAALGQYTEEGWRVNKDGSRFWAHVVITAIHDENGDVEAFGKLTRDLTPLKQAEEQRTRAFALLEATAATDSLTGLANRRAWDEALDREVSRADREGTPFCIAVLDLDHFKDYNDEFGHAHGDQLLRRCAVVWRSKLRATDVLARYGGEEFSLCLPQGPADEAVAIVDRLREATPGGRTCSAGVARWDRRETIDRLFGRADQALYDAKAAGRDQTVLAGPGVVRDLRISAVS
jgi:diguanylate cyclase (GGDEF)-like protein/PAS domain S-box-containing protein